MRALPARTGAPHPPTLAPARACETRIGAGRLA
jgi:hypothetical protein